MSTKKAGKLLKLLKRYWVFIVIGIVLAIASIMGALAIYYYYPDEDGAKVWHETASVLMTLGQTILGAGIIGGGLNFILENIKDKEQEVKDRLEKIHAAQDRLNAFRTEMREKLQNAYDNVELARILIKSHKSGRTYGEQIRNRIMPSLISLQDLQRVFNYDEDVKIHNSLDELLVSLNYMIAYLSALIEEFETSYLTISNLQTYQDALASRMRELFTEITEGEEIESQSLDKKRQFLEKAQDLFENTEVPSNIEVVWQAMQELDYIWDFIAELRDANGKRSLYNQFFLQHYFHCKKILRSSKDEVNQRLVDTKAFQGNIEKLKELEKKRNSDRPLTNQDNLARIIMEQELSFDFETKAKAKP